MDGGWTTMAAIAWSWPFAILVFPLLIGINVIMLIANKTETFNADLWNVWGKIFTAIGVVGITGSVPLAFVIAAIQIVFELKTADLFKDEINELTGIPGVTCTHKMIFLSAIFYPIDKVLRKVPALNTKADAAALKEKVGITPVNLLPYHTTGSSKYTRLGRPYLAADLEVPSDERMEHLKQMFLDNGYTDVNIGG